MKLPFWLHTAAPSTKSLLRQSVALLWVIIAALVIAACVRLFARPREAAELLLNAAAVYGMMQAAAYGLRSRTHS